MSFINDLPPKRPPPVPEIRALGLFVVFFIVPVIPVHVMVGL